MAFYMVYLFAGRYVWVVQAILVIALGVLAWCKPNGWPLAITGQEAAMIALVLAIVFTFLLVPVALMIVLRRHNREFPTSFTDPPGIVCMLQVGLLVAAGVNIALVPVR